MNYSYIQLNELYLDNIRMKKSIKKFRRYKICVELIPQFKETIKENKRKIKTSPDKITYQTARCIHNGKIILGIR